MPKKSEDKTDIVKKHEAAINAMSESEKKAAIAEQLESVETGDKQKAFYQAKEIAIAQQKQTGILAVEKARNKAKSDMDALEDKWRVAQAKGTWEIPV